MRLTIVGTGLIGGAVARAARARGLASSIIGVEPSEEHARLAVEHGVVDAIVDFPPEEADLIALCCPSDQVAAWAQKLADHLAAVFDVGSVKAPIVGAVRKSGACPPNFVPAHPIAGSEKTGPSHAPDDLFAGRLVVLAPEPETGAEALGTVRKFWEGIGAECVEMNGAQHDELLAVTSHLPHLLAYAYMLQVNDADMRFTGGGFSDFTRIAAANPEMWWRIFKMNKTPVLAGLEALGDNLQRLKSALEADDDARGLELLTDAANRRGRL